VWRRTANTKSIMSQLCLYPNESKLILEDYKYSIKNTHRSVLQILNIEDAIKQIKANNIEGSLVEAGMYTGGASAYMLLSASRNLGNTNREYWGFDSFQGMPMPSPEDGDYAAMWVAGVNLSSISEDSKYKGSRINLANIKDVKRYIEGTGYDAERLHIVKGWFHETLIQCADNIGKIALLRLDADFYEPTRISLEILYPLLVDKGILIIDDYGAFEGCKKAVDEYFEEAGIKPVLHYVDHSIRYVIKGE